MVDNKLTPGLKSYAARARAHRERETMAVHQRNLARSVQRGAEQHRIHDVDQRWNASPALLKARPGNSPASAVGLTPQTHTRALVRADERVPAKPELAKRLGGAEDLMYELGGVPTPLGQLRTPSGPPSMVARAGQLGSMADNRVVRHGYTHRERAVLWGTSLGQYQQVVAADDVDSASALGMGRRRRQKQCGSGAFSSAAAGQVDDPAAPDYEYHDLHQIARSRVLNALISDRRQRTDEGVLKEAEAAWKSIPARRQDGRLASTLCCLMHDLGVERPKIDAFYASHCSKSERDRIAASKKPQSSASRQGREGAGATQKNGKTEHLDLVASNFGLSDPSGRGPLSPLKSSFGASFESSNR
jgi:hypothetical protein